VRSHGWTFEQLHHYLIVPAKPKESSTEKHTHNSYLQTMEKEKRGPAPSSQTLDRRRKGGIE
jgi:hypothetical protein